MWTSATGILRHELSSTLWWLRSLPNWRDYAQSRRRSLSTTTCNLAWTDYLFITNANRHENSTFGQIRLTENDIAIFDRGYFNKRQFQELAESSISFVTRNKSNIEYEVISSDKKEKSDDSFTIRRDEIIRMKIGQSKKNHTYVTLRQAVSRDNDAERKLHSWKTGVRPVRWKSPPFIKNAGKRNSTPRTLIVHLLSLILKAETGQDNRVFSSSCSEISVVLFKHRNPEKWFARDYEKSPPKPPPDRNSLWLFDELAG